MQSIIIIDQNSNNNTPVASSSSIITSSSSSNHHPQQQQTPEFCEHVARLFAPLKPGLAYVRTMEYAVNDFECNHVDPDITDTLAQAFLLGRARLDAIRCVDFLEMEIIDLIELDATEYARSPNPMNYAWNAKNAEELRINLCGFCDGLIDIWEEHHHPAYHAAVMIASTDPNTTTPLPLYGREALSEYVKSFVGCASAALPYHLEEGEEEIYYDSDDTEEAVLGGD